MNTAKLALVYRFLLKKNAFIAERKNMNGRIRHCIYLDYQNPLLIITKAEYTYISPVLKTGQPKTEILSRSLVRQQHGKSHLKSIYLKVYKELKDELKSNTRNSNAIQEQSTS